MGLTQLKTDLASFKFGDSRFSDGKGGSVSNQPYIGNNLHFIGDPVVNNLIGNVDENAQGYLDFILRGGINAPLDSAQDIIRMTKFFTDFKSFKGVGFIAKENILSRISVATQASGNQSSKDKYQNAALNQGTYTPLRTIAQVGINAFGGHLEKQTLTPLGAKPILTYTDVVQGKNFLNTKTKGSIVAIDNNRLVQFLDNQQSLAKGNTEDKDGNLISPVNLYSYSGGPNSKLGIGRTNITFATDAKGAPLRTTDFTRDNVTKQTDLPVTIGGRTPFPLYGGDQFKPSGTNNRHIIDNMNNIPNGGILKNAPSILGVTLRYSQILGGEVVYGKDENGIDNFGDLTVKNDKVRTSQNLVHITNGSGIGYTNQIQNSVYENTITEDGKVIPSLKNTSRANDNLTKTLSQTQIEAIGNTGTRSEDNPFRDPTGGVIYLKNTSTGYNDPTIHDFRKTLLQDEDGNTVKSSNIMSISPSYNGPNSKAIEGISDSRIKQISPGQKGNIINYQKGKVNTDGKISVVDQINFQPLYKSSAVRSTKSGVAKNDFVKFRIGAILRDSEKVFIHFRAFIDSFSDAYSSTWDSIKYMGRGEDFYKYGGFGRKISLSFTVAAQSKPELMAQYKKLNYLASTLAPDYGKSGYMGGVLTTLTLGGWCYELPGFIDNLTLEVPQESPWEIAIPATDDGGDPQNPTFSDNTVKEMPHICKVSMNFTPIHTFRPELQENTYDGEGGEVNSYTQQHFLALSNGINNNYNPLSLSEAQTDPTPPSKIPANSTTTIGQDPQQSNDDLYLKDGSTIGDRERAINDPNPFIP